MRAPMYSTSGRLALRAMIRIRPIENRDHAALLTLNAASWPAVTRLNQSDLDTLFGHTGSHWVAEDVDAETVVGYLLSFPSDSAYDDEEIRAFRARVEEPFVYICQVALAPRYQRIGLGHALYGKVFHEARSGGRRFVCTEVNIQPPNEASLRFHLGQGFLPLAELDVSYGFRVLMLTLSTPAGGSGDSTP